MFIEGHLDRVEEVYQRGLRHLQLLHERDDMASPLGDVNTGPAHLGGLTPFGAQVVKECNRLGILVDLAHASDETVLGALKVATQPFIVSHTSLNSRTGGDSRMVKTMQPRLISKEHAKVVADAGGVVGVWAHLAGSLPDFVESIKSMVDAIGIDHVGIGSDTDLLPSRAGQGTNKAWPGLTGGFFDAVAGEMLRQGFTPDEIVKAGGGNYCRVFGEVTLATSDRRSISEAVTVPANPGTGRRFPHAAPTPRSQPGTSGDSYAGREFQERRQVTDASCLAGVN